MNKYDWVIVGIVLIVIIILYTFMHISSYDGHKLVQVYYEKNKILTIDLAIKDKKIYEVNGYNGKVKIESINGKVRVIEEKSPLHLCSRQGYISETYESIICLPNKIVINIEANNDYDTVIE